MGGHVRREAEWQEIHRRRLAGSGYVTRAGDESNARGITDAIDCATGVAVIGDNSDVDVGRCIGVEKPFGSRGPEHRKR